MENKIVTIIFTSIFTITLAVLIYLRRATELDYHSIRGIVGVVFMILCGIMLVGLKIYLWNLERNYKNKNK